MADDNPLTQRPPPPDIDPLAVSPAPKPEPATLSRKLPLGQEQQPSPQGSRHRTLIGAAAPVPQPPPLPPSSRPRADEARAPNPDQDLATAPTLALFAGREGRAAAASSAPSRSAPGSRAPTSGVMPGPSTKPSPSMPLSLERGKALPPASDRYPLSLPRSGRYEPSGAPSTLPSGSVPPPPVSLRSAPGGVPLAYSDRRPTTGVAGAFNRFVRWTRDYFLVEEPRFWAVVVPLIVLAIALFARSPATNYIFDEQEALLANPYVNKVGGLRFIDAIHRDFWGLPPDRSVGSYRPIPNFLWRLLWGVSKAPFFHHVYNVIFHAAVAALLVGFAYRLTRRVGLSWLTGLFFVTCALLTEAVSGIVGIADVMGGLGALAALAALSLPAWGMPFAVFTAVLLGLFCKESALVCVPLIPFAALVAAPLTHPERPSRALRAALALIGSACAFIVYVELRKRWFPSPLPSELSQDLPANASRLQRHAREFLIWFHQAPLPKDPLNNPLVDADTPHRIAGALRVYWRGLVQIVFPRTLSGDYSYPQEPIPSALVFPESIAGAAMIVLPVAASIGMWLAALRGERRDRSRISGRDSDFLIAGPPVTFGYAVLRPIGGILLGVVGGFVVLDAFVFRARGQLAAFHALPWWVQLVCVAGPLALALGLIGEGGARASRLDALDRPVPLKRAALVLSSIGLMWMVVSYFPHSNIPVVLPTVRAERFWYFPAIGTSLVLASAFATAHAASRSRWLASVVVAVAAAFFGFQGVQAYRHAMDYRNDVDFWEATMKAVPNSAKAHLNYSVMKGARGDLELRLRESKIAMQLAPSWPMAQVYTGDTLCRLHRADEAWPYYRQGFDIGPNELSLIALGLQCLYDEGKLAVHDEELRALANKHESSWIAYLAIDTLENAEKNKGVDPKYRPRGYNEGPKDN